MPLAAGDLLQNRYRIVQPLGRGGMSRVYLAEDTRLNLLVALKENLQQDPAARAQFQREAELLARLSHPNLPRVSDHFTDPATGAQYLVMDYVEGEDLQCMLQRQGPLPEQMLAPWLSQVMLALEYLHAQNPPVIHRDIKPGNIKVTPQGRAVLVDFGIAKVHQEHRGTYTGARAVTPGFASPEQYGMRTDQRSDVYSLGATMYALLTGVVPPEAPTRVGAARALTPPSTLLPGKVALPTQAAMLGALEMETTRRWQSVAQMRAALEGRAVAPPWEPTPLPRKSGLPPWAWGAVTVGTLLVAVLGLVGLGGGLGPPPQPTATPAPAGTATIATALIPATARPTLPPATAGPTSIAPTTPAQRPRIAYTGRDGYIWVMNDDGTGKQRLAEGREPSWAPDGSRIVFSRYAGPKLFDYDLWVMNADGTAQRRLTTGTDTGPVWSPDGKAIAFERTESIGGRLTAPVVYVINPDGTGQRRLTPGIGPTWAADSSRIAVMWMVVGEERLTEAMLQAGVAYSPRDERVMLVDTATARVTVLGEARCTRPAWSQDGKRIACLTDNTHILLMDPDGGNQKDVAPSGSWSPSWSPDGKRIAYQKGLDYKTATIQVMDVAGGSPVTLAEGGEPEWQRTPQAATQAPTPDMGAGAIAYRGPDGNLWLMNSDGTDQRMLVSVGEMVVHVTWFPDGKRIMFTTSSHKRWYTINADGSGLASRPFDNVDWVSFSPDGTRLVGQLQVDQATDRGTALVTMDIVVQNVDGTNRVSVTGCSAARSCSVNTPAWSPDGQWLAFIGYEGIYKSTSRQSLLLMRPDGTGETTIASPVGTQLPAWSPDGKRIAVVVNKGSAGYRVSVLNVDGAPTAEVPLLATGGHRPSWSPDGLRLAVEAYDDGTPRSAKVYVVNADGSRPVALGPGGDPAWQPAAQAATAPTALPAATVARGEKIAFFSDRDTPGKGEIYLMNPDGSGLVRLSSDLQVPASSANGPPAINGFAWSVLARRFFYDWGGKLYSADANGRDRSLNLEDVAFFDVSPDGRRLAFSTRGTARDSDIVVANADGTGRIVLTNAETRVRLGLPDVTNFHHPSWSPDGRRIAFYAAAGTSKLCTMEADGTAATCFVSSAQVQGLDQYRWSSQPELAAILAVNGPEASRGLYLERRGSGGVFYTKIASNVNHAFSWAPDASRIAYDSPDGHIWVVKTEATGLTQLTKTGHNCCPIWIADWPG